MLLGTLLDEIVMLGDI